MIRHAQDCHTILAFEKIVELQEQITEVKSQNQQLHVHLKDKSELIEKLSDRLACVEKFIRSGVEIPDFVEADCATTTHASTWKQTSRQKFHTCLLDTRNTN